MDNIRNRARENFPSVLLTLLSIIQAIALESLWDHARDRPELYGYSWDALLVLLFALTALAYNAYVQAKFWRVSMGN